MSVCLILKTDVQIKAFPSYLNNVIKAPSVEISHLAAYAGEELKWERPYVNTEQWKIM